MPTMRVIDIPAATGALDALVLAEQPVSQEEITA